MKYLIFKQDCPILLLSSITESGYTLNTDEDKAMLFPSEEVANEVITTIPGTDPGLWGTRPRRPKKSE